MTRIKFKEVKNTIYKQAWIAVKIYPGIEFETYVSEGYFRLLKCCQNYKPNNGCCFNTYLTGSLKKYFAGFILKEKQKKSQELENKKDAEPKDNHCSPDDYTIFKNLISSLGEDCEIILQILFDNGNITNQTALRNHLRDTWRGKNAERRIHFAFSKIKKALKDL